MKTLAVAALTVVTTSGFAAAYSPAPNGPVAPHACGKEDSGGRLLRQLEPTYQVRGENSPYVATFYHVADRFIAHVVPREAVREKPAPAGSVAITDVKVALVVFDEAFEKLHTFLM